MVIALRLHQLVHLLSTDLLILGVLGQTVDGPRGCGAGRLVPAKHKRVHFVLNLLLAQTFSVVILKKKENSSLMQNIQGWIDLEKRFTGAWSILWAPKMGQREPD